MYKLFHRYRATLIIISTLVTTTIAILFVLHFLLGIDLLESYSNIPPRPIDKNSPVYKYATELSGNMAIIQCDGTPSVPVGNLFGYRILLMKNWEYIPGSAWRMRCEPFHKDIILVPSTTETIPKLNQISWEKVKQQEQVDAVYMGEGHGYHWFGRMTIPDQDGIRERYKLKGGDDRQELFVKYLNRFKDKKERKQALEILAQCLDEKAIPILKHEIERDKYGCRMDAIRALGFVPHKEATDILLSFYENEENRSAVEGALLYSFDHYHEAAKQFYLDMLNPKCQNYPYFSQALKAVIEFGWKESILLLEKNMENPYNIEHYVKCCKAIRSLNNNPIPSDLMESEDIILRVETWQSRTPPPDDVEHARERIKNHNDVEGALLVSLSLATVSGTFNNFRRTNDIGVNLLCILPHDKVLPVLNHLGTNTRDINSRDKAIAITAVVLAYELSPSDISPIKSER